jgi:hypothetical protein
MEEGDDGWGPPVSGRGWAALGQKAKAAAAQGGAATGLPALAGRKGEKEGGNLKERVPIFSKHNQTLNSNEFEFKHPKMMHRHVCKKCFMPRKTQSLYIP